jgi:flagellar basal body-associated protein FliL
MKEHNEIDLLFQSTFDGLELPLDPTMKEKIDRAIAAKKKRRRFLFILFPVLFGTTGFTAMLYFNPFSEKTSPNKELTFQNHLSTDLELAPNAKNNPVEKQNDLDDPIVVETNSKEKKPLVRTNFKLNSSSLKTKSIDSDQNESTIRVKETSFLHEGQPPLGTEKKNQNIPLNSAPEKLENKTLTKQDTVTLAEIKSDSTAIPLLIFSDSLTNLLVATNQCVAPNQRVDKWSLSILSYWEGERKSNSNFEDHSYIKNKNENARLHSSTFYGKLEVNRKLTTQLEVLTGIGFRSSKVIQYGYLSKIETPITELGSGGILPSTEPDTVYSKQNQSFQINSVVLPIGLAYSIPLIRNIQMRLSGGAEFAYGKISSQYIQSDLSAPRFRSFGCNIWLRPELHYTIGKVNLFGFGSFNQSLSQQLQWDFKVRRNPAFGAGIGVLINM